MKVNINENVKVKLTTYGLEVLDKHFPVREWTEKLRTPDDEGYQKFQLWELMQVYGEVMYIGNPNNVFEQNEIIIEKEITTMTIKVIEEQNKVVLTQAQADAIEDAIKYKMQLHVIKLQAQEPFKPWEDEYLSLNEMPLDTLIRALYIGYEVERTPEEQLLYCYKETSSLNEDFRDGYRAGIQGALSMLNIKVKGINA